MDFEFLSSNLHIAYPFTDDVTVERPSGLVPLAPLMASLRVYTSDQRDADLFMDEIDLRSNDSFATLATAAVTLRWSDDSIQFTLTDGGNATARVTAYGDWITVRWQHTTEDFIIQVVFPAAQVEGAAPETFRFWKYASEDIKVLAGLVKQGPGKINRIYVKRGSTLYQLVGPGEELVIKPGFNMQIGAGADDTTATGRQLSRVAMNAVPGAGGGKYLICKNDQYLLTLNGVGGDDNGNVNLSPEECYWLDLPLAGDLVPVPIPQHGITRTGVLGSNQLKLRNACGPCCSCENYVKTYDHLKTIWNGALTASERYRILRSQFEDLVAEWTAKHSSDNILTLTQTGRDTFNVIVSAWNNTNVPITADFLFTLAFTLPGGVTFEHIHSLVVKSGQPVYVQPNDLTTTPNITVSDDLEPFQMISWISTWRLSGIVVANKVEIAAVISGGLTRSESEDLTWISL